MWILAVLAILIPLLLIGMWIAYCCCIRKKKSKKEKTVEEYYEPVRKEERMPINVQRIRPDENVRITYGDPRVISQNVKNTEMRLVDERRVNLSPSRVQHVE